MTKFYTKKEIEHAEPGGYIGSSSDRNMDFFLCWRMML